VSNLATGCVEYLADERRQASLDGFFSQFSADVRNGIEAVAMDMWDPRPPDPYITSTRQHLADADDKIVFDRYRLIAHLTKAVDTVRKQENRALVAKGDKR
jgi:transposase